jgi:hypothetical protein
MRIDHMSGQGMALDAAAGEMSWHTLIALRAWRQSEAAEVAEFVGEAHEDRVEALRRAIGEGAAFEEPAIEIAWEIWRQCDVAAAQADEDDERQHAEALRDSLARLIHRVQLTADLLGALRVVRRAEGGVAEKAATAAAAFTPLA